MQRLCVCVGSVVSNSLQRHGLQPTSTLCPWNSPGKNTGVGCYFLLQGIFLTQGSNPQLCLLHWQADSLPLAAPGKPTASKCQKKPIYKEAKLLKALTLKALRFHVISPGLCSLWNQSMETNTKKLTVTSEVPPPPPNTYLL